MRTLIVEADGTSRGNPGPAAYGAVVRGGETGELIGELAGAIGVAGNNAAEYRGVIAGLEAAAEYDPAARIEVRLDSKLVVEQLSGRWQVNHPEIKALVARAQRALPAHGQVSFSWVPRSSNVHADRLANEVLDAAARGQEWAARTPMPGPVAPGPARDQAADRVTAAQARSSEDQAGEDPASIREAVVAVAVAVADADAAAAVAEAAATESQRPAQRTKVGWAADLGTPTRLLLLRHGVTPLTGEKRFSGVGGDPDLTELGQTQARAAAERLIEARFGRIDAILASPLLRTQQTAQAVADRTGLPVRTEPGLREMDFGRFEGLTFAEARHRFPAEVDAWLASADVAPPGGESLAAAAARSAQARDRIIARFPRRTVLAVTHVTPIKALVCQALGAPLAAGHRMELGAASLTVIDYYDDDVASVRCVNDTSYLPY
ncbi:MAG TPA: bifunctional RNase H/acid phosphatase [Actinocrinis sp.]|nr:bifunctional RNase H/acid phosphatase [Actinocrinis sp.]